MIHSTGLGMLIGTFSWAYAMTLPCGVSENRIWRAIYISVILILNIIMGLMELVVGV